MKKRDLVDGVVGPRTREMMDQMLCMKGMTLTEKVDFLMSRSRELRAENEKLRDENARLRSCLSDDADNARQIIGENAKLRELVRDMWEFGFGDNSGANDAWAWHERTDELEGRMAELGVEVET